MKAVKKIGAEGPELMLCGESPRIFPNEIECLHII
jgi:hypothetical protein